MTLATISTQGIETEKVFLSRLVFVRFPKLKEVIQEAAIFTRTQVTEDPKGITFSMDLWRFLCLSKVHGIDTDLLHRYITLPDLELIDFDAEGEEKVFIEYKFSGNSDRAYLPFWFIKEHVDRLFNLEIDDLEGTYYTIHGEAYTWDDLEYFISSFLETKEIVDLLKVAILKSQINDFSQVYWKSQSEQAANDVEVTKMKLEALS